MNKAELDFKKLIKQYRENMFLTQEELGDIVGVSYVTVNRWENGVSTPSLKQKKKLYKMFLDANILSED